MQTSALKPYFVLVGLMFLTVLAIAFTVDVRITGQAGVRTALPAKVGEWTGEEIRFCQNPTCDREFRLSSLADPKVCPACGGDLDTMSYAEKAMLPADTLILKKQYTNPSGRVLFATMVLSGKERVSIHRPQVCLIGQGNVIMRSSVLDVPFSDRPPLKVMVLDTIRPMQGPDGKPIRATTFFAYWFVGKDRETPYHVQRMIWMAADRIFRNISHRWAYLAVAGTREKDSDAYREDIRTFLHDFYPQMVIREG